MARPVRGQPGASKAVNPQPAFFTLALKRLQAGAPVSDPASAKWLGDAGSETGAPEGVKCPG